MTTETTDTSTMLEYLDEHGNAQRDIAVPDDTLVEMYRLMVMTRAYDERALTLQRTGRIPAYYQCSGQEAHVAVGLALEPGDWVMLAYREQGVRFARGISILEDLAIWKGRPDLAWDPAVHRVSPLTATIGTHLPHATGIGYAGRVLGTDDVAMAIFGDGATSEGDFHAALNAAGVWRTSTVFFCQNNQYAQSTPYANQTAAETIAQKADAYGIPGVRVDGMDAVAVYEATKEAVERARRGDGPTLIEALMYRYAAHSTYDGVPVYRTREEETLWAGRDPLIRLGAYLRNRGLIDDGLEERVTAETRVAVEAAIVALDDAPLPGRVAPASTMYREMPGHLASQLVEEAEVAGEAPIAIDDVLGIGDEPTPEGPAEAMTMVQALNRTLDEAMAADPTVVVLGEDVAVEGGVFRVTEDLLEHHGQERVLDTPLNELGIVGSAVGMAIAGLRPVCEIEFAGFMNTAFDQIIFHAARYRWRTAGSLSVPMVIRMPGGGGHQGLEGHSDSPESFFVHAPGLAVVYPSNAYDARGLLASAIDSDDPVVFFEPIVRYFVREDDVPTEPYRIPIGRARVARAGTDLTLVAYGNAVNASLDAADGLAGDGVSVEVIDLRTLKPWDVDTVLGSVSRTGRLVVAHEAPIIGGFGAEVVATVMEKAGDVLEGPPVRVGHADLIWNPALLEVYSLVGPERIAAAVRKAVLD
jgi:pyruvate/2-oxoglutarate/acetoin dehydrogenase E1 component/TPP-dependent pyruvate/acetoin dehydrogenase alpha subunit